MTVALERAQASPHVASLDPWVAYTLGLGVYEPALTAVPAMMYGVLLVDENQSLRSHDWQVYLRWIGGHLGAALLGFLGVKSRALLGPGFHSVEASGPEGDEPATFSAALVVVLLRSRGDSGYFRVGEAPRDEGPLLGEPLIAS